MSQAQRPRVGSSSPPTDTTQTPRQHASPPASSHSPPAQPQTHEPTAPPSGGLRNTFSSLKEPNFLVFWLGLLALMAGVQMQMLTRGYLVYDITGSASLLGIVSAGSAVPILGLSLFGGAVADRFERKRVIQGGQALTALLALVVAVSITTDRIAWYHLLVASIIQGGLWAFLMPARQALIPQLVPKEQLTNAVALSSAAMAATTLVSPAIAGWVYAFWGPDTVYYMIGGLCIIAWLLTGMISTTRGGPVKSGAPVMSDIAAGLSYIRRSPLVMVLLFMGLATTLLAFPFRFLLPVFVIDVYDRGPDSMGLLLTVMGGGALAGSLYVASLRRARRGLLLILGSFVSGVGLLLVAAIPSYVVAAPIMVLIGLGDAGRRSLNQALIMEVAEDRFRGRVMSVFMMNFGLMPLGVLPMGLVADRLGPQVAIGVLALLLLATTAVILATQKHLRELA